MDSSCNDFQNLPQKQQQIMTAGGEVFAKYGVRRVSVNDICEHAGVSKMTFYKFFSNKWDLAKAVMESLAASEIEFYHFIVEGNEPFSQKVVDILTLALTRMYGVGLGQEFYDDISDTDSPLYAHYQEHRNRSKALVADFFADGQKKGLLDENTQLSFLLFAFQQVSEWVMNPEYVQIKPDIFRRIQEVSHLFFNGFSK